MCVGSFKNQKKYGPLLLDASWRDDGVLTHRFVFQNHLHFEANSNRKRAWVYKHVASICRASKLKCPTEVYTHFFELKKKCIAWATIEDYIVFVVVKITYNLKTFI